MTELTYTLTLSQLEEVLNCRLPDPAHDILTSLKPKSQKARAWLVTFESGDEELHFEEASLGETQEALYTHPASISKEDILKVLAALESNRIMGRDRNGNYTIEITPERTTEAIAIMQRAIEANVEKEKPVAAQSAPISIEQAHVEGMI